MFDFETYIKKDKQAFITKVIEVSNALKIDPNWLFIVMFAESRFDCRARNRKTDASGLIQFMPRTARALGTTTAKIREMNFSEQLDLVLKFYQPYKHRINSVYDLYQATFLPISLGKPDSWIMRTNSVSPAVLAKQNPAVDLNKNGEITVGEFKKYVDSYLHRRITENSNNFDTFLSEQKKNNIITIIVPIIAGIAIGTILFKNIKR